MNTPEEEDTLVAAVTSAYRDRHPDGVRAAPAWFDLSSNGRERAFVETVEVRRIEAALDPRGLSSTARAVLARLGG